MGHAYGMPFLPKEGRSKTKCRHENVTDSRNAVFIGCLALAIWVRIPSSPLENYP